MQVPCYECEAGGAPVNLEVVPGLIRCQVRRKWLAITPEELVRQALVQRLLSSLGNDALERLEVIVEGASLDIALFMRLTGTLFQPALPPLLIVETKRRDIEVLDAPEHERQLLGYLRRTRGRDGVLANCEELWHYCHSKDSYTKTKLSGFAALIDLVQANLFEKQQVLQEQQRWFDKARVGDYSSFRRLVEMYGRSADSTIKFIFEDRGQLAHISGFLFQIDDEKILCMPRGQAVQKKLVFPSNTFRRLHSITSLR